MMMLPFCYRLRAMLAVVGFLFLTQPAFGQKPRNDPLASWNNGPAKKAILKFVRVTTTKGSKQYVPRSQRIATFDMDGTLWVEHPMYTQVVYCLDRVAVLAAKKPELKEVQPFKTVLSGDRAAIAKLSYPDLDKIAAA